MSDAASLSTQGPPVEVPPRVLDVDRVRRDFPILSRRVHEYPLVYLDNAATTQRPAAVLGAVARHEQEHNANVHRGVHRLSQEATEAYEGARQRVRRFLGAALPEEIIFLRGVTEAMNLVANAYGNGAVGPGDEILLTQMEHHSNIVPWKMLCERTGATLRVAPVDDRGDLIMEEVERLLTERTKIAAVAHVSNALGTINPVREITAMAKRVGAAVVIDGAQAAPHADIDVREIGCDFYAISGHKTYGPTGIGALYGRRELLEAMPPWQGGGEMIETVSFDSISYATPPARFEAGTPNIAGAVGLGAATGYLEDLGLGRVRAHELALLTYATERLSEIPGVRLIGRSAHKAPVVSFTVEGAHPHDVGTIVDQMGVAIRTGHHCAQPLMERFGVPATARASFGVYNTREEVDALVDALNKARSALAL